MYIIRNKKLAHFPIEESTKRCLKNASPKCRSALNSPLSAVLSPQLALSSDKISSLQTPLLNLSLDVRENGALRTVNVEMNREELNMLISSLEAANKVHTPLKYQLDWQWALPVITVVAKHFKCCHGSTQYGFLSWQVHSF